MTYELDNVDTKLKFAVDISVLQSFTKHDKISSVRINSCI